MNYYLYRHIRLDKNEPFYIGIGTGKGNPNTKSFYDRAYSKLRNKIWKRIADKTEYEVEILMHSDNYDFILQKEIEFISYHGRINNHTGILANLTDGGEGVTGRVTTEEFRRKCSENNRKRIPKNKGISPSLETRRKISLSLLGNKLNPETIAKGVNTRKRNAELRGYFHSEKWKKSISNANSKTIYQYDLTGNLIAEFKSCHDVERKIGFSYKAVSQVARGKRRHHKNFIWSYKKEENLISK